MFFVGIFLCVVVAIVIGTVMPKKENYNKLDKIGFIFNIILSVLYVPMSLYGVFSLFAADIMFMYSETIQKIIDLMITIGITLPFVSVLGIVLSVIFRKKGKRILSFTIQFIPLIPFIVMVVTFELISNIQV
ncbi:MAG: hypothetical protein E7623_06495 [Ruminococcaceae bacterium]|nr:hypothetical protein [Oscillospiraceae bacterium]